MKLVLRGQGKNLGIGSDQPSGSLDPDGHSECLRMYCQFPVNYGEHGHFGPAKQEKNSCIWGKINCVTGMGLFCHPLGSAEAMCLGQVQQIDL